MIWSASFCVEIRCQEKASEGGEFYCACKSYLKVWRIPTELKLSVIERNDNWSANKSKLSDVEPIIFVMLTPHTCQYSSVRIRADLNTLLEFSRGLNNSGFWDIRPCVPAKVDRNFGGTYGLHLHCRRAIQGRKQHEACGMYCCLAWLTLKPEDAAHVFLREVDWLSLDYTALYPWR
jgi:hypothetical protein